MNSKKRVEIGKININFTNKWLYSFIALFIFLFLGIGIFAQGAGEEPVGGHSIDDVGAPEDCEEDEFLMYGEDGWECDQGGSDFWENGSYTTTIGGESVFSKNVFTDSSVITKGSFRIRDDPAEYDTSKFDISPVDGEHIGNEGAVVFKTFDGDGYMFMPNDDPGKSMTLDKEGNLNVKGEIWGTDYIQLRDDPYEDGSKAKFSISQEDFDNLYGDEDGSAVIFNAEEGSGLLFQPDEDWSKRMVLGEDGGLNIRGDLDVKRNALFKGDSSLDPQTSVQVFSVGRENNVDHEDDKLYWGLLELEEGTDRAASGTLAAHRGSHARGWQMRFHAESGWNGDNSGDPDDASLVVDGLYSNDRDFRLVEFKHNGNRWLGIEHDCSGGVRAKEARFIGYAADGSSPTQKFPKLMEEGEVSDVGDYSSQDNSRQYLSGSEKVDIDGELVANSLKVDSLETGDLDITGMGSIDNLEIKNLDIGKSIDFGSGSCTGEATECSDLSDSECESQSSCSVGCYDDPGFSEYCSDFDSSEYSCNSKAECTYSSGGYYSTGSCNPDYEVIDTYGCGGLGSNECDDYDGACSWGCSGQASSCDSFAFDSQGCRDQDGCSWSSSTPREIKAVDKGLEIRSSLETGEVYASEYCDKHDEEKCLEPGKVSYTLKGGDTLSYDADKYMCFLTKVYVNERGGRGDSRGCNLYYDESGEEWVLHKEGDGGRSCRAQCIKWGASQK